MEELIQDEREATYEGVARKIVLKYWQGDTKFFGPGREDGTAADRAVLTNELWNYGPEDASGHGGGVSLTGSEQPFARTGSGSGNERARGPSQFAGSD